MTTILNFIHDSLRQSFGAPVALLNAISKHPEMRVQTLESAPVIGFSSVVPWHKWGELQTTGWPRREAGCIMGWKETGGYYSGFEAKIEQLKNFGQQHEITSWSCDICDVEGFASSKSILTDFSNMDEMVETNSREMICEINETKLNENLDHTEIRIIHNPKTSDYFARHLWDGRIFLMNDGGSHHFAAARYIAARLERQIPLAGKLRTHSVNEDAVNALRHNYELFVISDSAPVAVAFNEAMDSFMATYLWMHMPPPYEQTRAILLPRNENRSMRVAKELRVAGMFDLGEYLKSICDRQKQCLAEKTAHHAPEKSSIIKPCTPTVSFSQI